MKKKIGFLAIIALLAMSFTIASRTDAFKAKFVDVQPGGCYTSVATCPTGGTPASGVCISTGTEVTSGVGGLDCNSSNSGQLCCYKISATATACNDNPPNDPPTCSGYPIDQVFKRIQ